MQEKNVPEKKPGQGMPETGKQGGQADVGKTDVGKKGGDIGQQKTGVGGDTGNTGEVGKQGR
jgi:hypothetical protein